MADNSGFSTALQGVGAIAGIASSVARSGADKRDRRIAGGQEDPAIAQLRARLAAQNAQTAMAVAASQQGVNPALAQRNAQQALAQQQVQTNATLAQHNANSTQVSRDADRSKSTQALNGTLQGITGFANVLGTQGALTDLTAQPEEAAPEAAVQPEEAAPEAPVQPQAQAPAPQIGPPGQLMPNPYGEAPQPPPPVAAQQPASAVQQTLQTQLAQAAPAAPTVPAAPTYDSLGGPSPDQAVQLFNQNAQQAGVQTPTMPVISQANAEASGLAQDPRNQQGYRAPTPEESIQMLPPEVLADPRVQGQLQVANSAASPELKAAIQRTILRGLAGFRIDVGQ